MFFAQGWVVWRVFGSVPVAYLYYCVVAVAEGVAVAIRYRIFGLCALAGGFIAAAAVIGDAIYWACKTNGWP